MLAFVACASTIAQTAGEYQVKSAYLYNFAKLTQWPVQALPREDSPVAICVVGKDEGFVNVLRAMMAGKTINSRLIAIRYLSAPRDGKSCHVVFFRGTQSENRAGIAELADAPVLLVGEDPEFLNAGGMVNLLLKEEKIGYEVNPDALRRANLHFGAEGTAQAAAGAMAKGEGRRVKSQVAPLYPELARKMELKGSVQLRATVRPDGTVKDVQVVGGHPLLASAAQEALMKWRFEPAPRETVEPVKVSFGD